MQTWIRANVYYQMENYHVANNNYLQLYPNFKNEGSFLRVAGKSMSMTRKFYGSIQLLERALYFSSDPVIFTTLGYDYTLFGKVDLKKYDRAEFLLKMAKYMQPGHYYPRYLLFNLYDRTNQILKKRQEALNILAMKTKVKSEAVDEMRIAVRKYLNKNEYESKVQMLIDE